MRRRLPPGPLLQWRGPGLRVGRGCLGRASLTAQGAHGPGDPATRGEAATTVPVSQGPVSKPAVTAPPSAMTPRDSETRGPGCRAGGASRWMPWNDLHAMTLEVSTRRNELTQALARRRSMMLRLGHAACACVREEHGFDQFGTSQARPGTPRPGPGGQPGARRLNLNHDAAAIGDCA
jgi:hypothetical protein